MRLRRSAAQGVLFFHVSEAVSPDGQAIANAGLAESVDAHSGLLVRRLTAGRSSHVWPIAFNAGRGDANGIQTARMRRI